MINNIPTGEQVTRPGQKAQRTFDFNAHGVKHVSGQNMDAKGQAGKVE